MSGFDNLVVNALRWYLISATAKFGGEIISNKVSGFYKNIAFIGGIWFWQLQNFLSNPLYMYITTQISDLEKFTGTKTEKVSFFTSRMNFTNKNYKRAVAFVLSILSSSSFLSFQFSILPIRQGINPIDKNYCFLFLVLP